MSAAGTAQPTLPQYGLPPPPPPSSYGHPYVDAGLGIRFGAAILDLIVLAVLELVIIIPLGLIAWGFGVSASAPAWVLGILFGPVVLVMISLWLIYFTFFESTSGQTPGKRAVGIRVIDVNTGRAPSLGRALLRNLLRIVDWLPALYLVGFVVALLTSRKQRLGDLIAETVVVRT
jgi:uncharacterized RDD family membrane protein YckC